MTKEEKELLLKDLCARLLHGVKFACNKNIYTAKGIDLIVTDEGNWEYAVTAKGIEPIEIDFIKPYLRPISSMTEKEKKEIGELLDASIDIDIDGNITYFGGSDFIPCSDYRIYIDYLISHHFDYRGLIPMGLALEAPDGIYK